jgi:AcrR family transcriptional regulator
MSAPNEQRRSERARRAILDAALELCREQGLAKTTMEAIAKRAGVGKQTIYRWWGSKVAVVEEALNEQAQPVTGFPDTGDLRADLYTQMSGVAKLFVSAEFTPYLSLLGAAQEDPDLAKSVRENMIEPRVRDCRDRLRHAQEQGQLRQDIDLDDAIELLYAPLYYRLLLHNRLPSEKQVADIIELAFTGLAPE